jgi:hypothetical protein
MDPDEIDHKPAPCHPRVGGEKAGVAISTLGVISMLLLAGNGEITTSVGRSHEIAYDLLVMTPVGKVPSSPQVSNSQ